MSECLAALQLRSSSSRVLALQRDAQCICITSTVVPRVLKSSIHGGALCDRFLHVMDHAALLHTVRSISARILHSTAELYPPGFHPLQFPLRIIYVFAILLRQVTQSRGHKSGEPLRCFRAGRASCLACERSVEAMMLDPNTSLRCRIP